MQLFYTDPQNSVCLFLSPLTFKYSSVGQHLSDTFRDRPVSAGGFHRVCLALQSLFNGVLNFSGNARPWSQSAFN